MLRRLLIVSLLLWGALSVPALCRAGMLEHLCACDVASNCAHEEDCSSDPCLMAKPAKDVVPSGHLVASAPFLPTLPFVIDCRTLGVLDPWMQSSHERPATPVSLRPGARPLLV